MKLGKYSLGMGDRFRRQGVAQLRAVRAAEAAGVHVSPVWNKSNREHAILGTTPASVREEADAATSALGWTAPYFVDADHIGLATVDRFLTASDFFTLDVADFLDKAPSDGTQAAFFTALAPMLARGKMTVPGLDAPLLLDEGTVAAFARRYLGAVSEAGKIYRHVAGQKGAGTFVTEVSVDEALTPQNPAELFLLLAALSFEGVPADTVAPKFSGHFLKGVDYVGDVEAFAREVDADLAVVRHAVEVFSLPATLKLSVHSGSDKRSLYPVLRRLLRKHDAGLHLKTAGTTWLEEIVAVALSSSRGHALALHVTQASLDRYDELIQPYATVVQIARDQLPSATEVAGWSATTLARRLTHDASCPDYDRNLRQLVHCGYKVAAELGTDYEDALAAAGPLPAERVENNLFAHHLRPLFLDA